MLFLDILGFGQRADGRLIRFIFGFVLSQMGWLIRFSCGKRLPVQS